MADLHITWVDIAVAAILLVSTIFAIYRGFVRETLSIFAWAAAAFATLYFGRYVVPLLASHMSAMLAQIVAYTAVFLLVLMPLLFLGNRFGQRVQQSPVGGLDRFLGAFFGILRGLVAIAMLYILYSLVVPVPAQAKWMKDARSLPLIQKSASALLALLPENDAEYLDSRAHRTTTTTSHTDTANSTPPSHTPAHHTSVHHRPVHRGYGADDRHALNRLIEATGNGGR